jgi:hypothetical protein
MSKPENTIGIAGNDPEHTSIPTAVDQTADQVYAEDDMEGLVFSAPNDPEALGDKLPSHLDAMKTIFSLIDKVAQLEEELLTTRFTIADLRMTNTAAIHLLNNFTTWKAPGPYLQGLVRDFINAYNAKEELGKRLGDLQVQREAAKKV